MQLPEELLARELALSPVALALAPAQLQVRVQVQLLEALPDSSGA
ncbi:MAG: hypothetical protein ACREIA_21135 [Opitutaceae bacterium]